MTKILYAVTCIVCLITFIGLSNAQIISLPKIEGEVGSTVEAAINVDSDVKSVGSIDITLTYDAKLLTATEVVSIVAGFTVLSNLNDAGKVIIGAFSADGSGKMIAAGAMFNVKFKVNADAKGISDLTFEEVILSDENGDEVAVKMENGKFTVKGGNIPPTANAGVAELAAKAGEEVQFDGSASKDDDGTITAFNWDFGDGEVGEGQKVTHAYAKAGEYTVTLTVTDDKGDTGIAAVKVTVEKKLEPAIREHTEGSPMLAFEGKFPKENISAKCYIDIWIGEFKIEAGQYLEYQVVVFSGNPSFNAGIDLHTTDGTLLSATDAKDEAGLSASPKTDLSVSIKEGEQDIKHAARDRWYHRKISLDALAGKTLDGIMIATESETNKVGKIRIYVDNIQITDGENRLLDVYIDNKTILDDKQDATEGKFVECKGIEDAKVLVGIISIGVQPAGKLPLTWGKIKAAH